MQRQATEARDIAKVDYLRQLARSTGTQERWKGEIADSIHSLASQYEYALDGVASGLEGVRDSIEGLRIDVSEGFEALGALFD